MRRSVPLVLMVVALAGCAAGSGSRGAAPARLDLAAPRSALQISDGELVAVHGAHNMLVALEQLRPGYRQSLGSFVRLGEAAAPAPIVYINGAYAGPIDVLQTMPVDQVAGIRLVRPMEAMQRYGSRLGGGGVILVTLRRPE
jgi:hypothetical protein